jgi:hypothetical protein
LKKEGVLFLFIIAEMKPIWYTLYKVEKTFKKQGINEKWNKRKK